MSIQIDAELHRMMDGLPAMLAAVDRDGRATFRNQACRAFFGLDENAEARHEDWITEFARGDDPEIRSKIENGSEVRFVRELTGIDGARRFEVSLIPSLSSDGEIRGYVALARDDDGAAAGDGAAALLDALPDGVLLFDREGRLRHVNSRFADVWPGSEERFAPGAGLDRIVAAVMDRASHEHCSGASKKEIAARIANPGDDVVEIELSVAGRVLSCRATRTDSGETMLTFRRDERRPEAGATRDGLADEILNTVAGQMPGLIARIDLDGRYVYASRSYSDWYGVPLDRIIGETDVTFMDAVSGGFVDPDSRRHRLSDIDAALSGQKVEFETQRLFPDGIERYIRGALIPAFGNDGEVRGVTIVTIDASEDKRRERAAVESEERYRSLVELSPSYIMVHREGVCLFANPTTNELYGIGVEDTLAGRNTLELVHPDSRAMVIERNIDLLHGKNPSEPTEIKIRRFDGTELILENRVARIRWNGEPAVLVVGSDVTDRKSAEQRLRDRELMFRGLVDASFDAVIVSDHGKVVDFNTKALELWGYDESELRGLDVLELVPDEIREFVDLQIKNEATGPYDAVNLRKDGRRFAVEISARTYLLGGRRVRVTAVRDLTQRNQAEQALRESEELLRLVVDNLPALISYLGADGRYKLANAGYEALYGVSRDRIVGRHFDEFVNGPLHDGETAKWREFRRKNVERALAGELIQFERERVFLDGETRQISGTMVPHVGPDGEVLGICILVQDISEQKRIEEALRWSENRFRDFAEASGDWFWETDLDQRFTYVSPREDPANVFAQDRNLIGKSRIQVHEEFGVDPSVTGRIQKRMDRGEPFRGMEIRMNFPDDGFQWLQLFGQPVANEFGEITRYRGIAVDITDRKRAEDALRQSQVELARIQARLIDAIESLPLGFTLYDADEQMIMSNSLMNELFPSYAHLFVPGTKFEEIIRFGAGLRTDEPDKEQWIQKRLAWFRRSGGAEEETITDGRWNHVSYRRTSEGGTVGIRYDITERKKAEEALRQSEERYRKLAQLLPDAVRVVTGQQVVYANDAAARLLGADSPEQIVGLEAHHFIDPVDREDIAERMARVDRGENVPWREQKLHGLGGRLVTVESAMTPIVWDGKPSRLLVNRDTRRYKLVENQLRQAVEEARQANVAKSRFLAAASHDLRQPIQALGLLNAAMAYEVEDPGQTEITTNMGHAIDAMRGVLDGLLDISKLEAGIVTPEVRAFRIAPLMERIVGELSFEANAKGLELRLVPSSAVVRSDRDLLERILQNFASNAIRYTTSGRVLIGCRRHGENLRLEVWDTGPGILEDQRDRIFEEFYQLDNPQRDRSEGLGLGLAIVDRMSRLLGHKVEVRSRPEAGSVFSVLLPIDTIDETAADDVPSLPLFELDGKRILVLDDDAEVVEATKTLLSRWGADAAGAHTSDEALHLATSGDRPPDLVIVDYVLADGETGTGVIRRIDEALGTRIPRIVISGDVSNRIHSEVRRARSVLLHKPVNPAKLRALIQHLLVSGGDGDDGS